MGGGAEASAPTGRRGGSLRRFAAEMRPGEGCGGDQTGAGRPGRLVASTRVGGIRGREERLSRRAAGQEEGMG